ncbi:aminopeptidase N-like isoform X2 [Hyperolius riggenbachi]|uniref:aminopeptidase N-like isoform X2 n=1 Tax=Hyperolius riggenbachi TaxID=752182 RepID=UPI0035A30D37
MAKGFYVSKIVAFVGIFFAIAAVVTIIALVVVYSNEKNNNVENGGSTSGTTTTTGTTTITGTTTTTGSATTTTTTSGTTSSTLKPATSTPASNEPWDQYRLPKTLVPDHYDLDLRPILEKNNEGLYVFHGESIVYFKCEISTNLVIIHSDKLNYTLTVLKDSAGNNIVINKIDIVEKTNYLVLHLAENLVQGTTYTLQTAFVGELADDMAGFYRSEYVEDGVTKIIATTQMQAALTRKAFPCFDEPALKATFNITIRHKPDYVALSNMNPISVTTETWDGQQWNVTVFDKTPKMSSYTVAFIISQFKYIGDEMIKIWGRKKAIEDESQGEYALAITGPMLTFFEDYYKIPYPLPKSDQVAIPDFFAGAQENWGLIAYRETALLWDSRESSIENKERVVTVIAHELAHQWFGNLVTVRWWNDLWLNEGFATYVEYLGVDSAEPMWNYKDLFILYDVHKAMAVDALVSSHPLSIEEEVNTTAQVNELFDVIAYSKGGSIVRMLSFILTEELFIDGLSSYLDRFKYDNTVYTDLWTHLQAAVDNQSAETLPPGENVTTIMDTWILQMGFPVVKVDTVLGSVTQTHFLLDSDSVAPPPSPFNYIWKVPITYLSSSGHTSNWWLLQRTDTHNDFKVTGNDWILVNINVTGYYRVNYDDGNWNRLLQQLNTDFSAIPVINRAQIIDDAFNLVRAKLIPTTRALETTKFLSKEVEYTPWQAALGSLSFFVEMFDRSEVFGPMKAYMRQKVRPLFDYFKTLTGNWTTRPATLTEQYNEVNAISTACSYGLPECEDLATEQFREWMNTNNNIIHPNLRSTIYCNAIATGGQAEWDFSWEKFKNTTNAQEADKLRAGLTCSKEPWILNRFGSTSLSFDNLITSVTTRFSTDFELKQLEQFKKENEEAGFGRAARALEQAIEKTKANIKWVAENKAEIKAWFENAVTTS